MELGHRLRLFRETKGKTQEQVALAIGVGYSTYRKYETENILPRSDVMERLAIFYDTSVDDLIGIGTTLMFHFDEQDVHDLMYALEMEDGHEKKTRLKRIIGRMNADKEMAFRPPDIPIDQNRHYAGQTLKITQYNMIEDALFTRGLDELLRLESEGGKRYDQS